MAFIISTNHEIQRVIPDDPSGYFKLAQLQAIVGGYIEAVYIDGPEGLPRCMVIHEEGKLIGLPVNQLATMMAHSWNAGIATDDFIVGPALITGVADTDDGQEMTALEHLDFIPIITRRGHR